MLFDDLRSGLRHARTITVTEALTVPASARIFSPGTDMPAVFATASMIAFVEWTCVEALAPYIGSEQRTVGTHVEMSHTAAAPIGISVTAEVELIEVEGSRLRFKTRCRDERRTIGEGFHERAIIDYRRFMDRFSGTAKAD